jgi:hypothetical protein
VEPFPAKLNTVLQARSLGQPTSVPIARDRKRTLKFLTERVEASIWVVERVLPL